MAIDKNDTSAYSEIFKALADETRVKIMLMLNTRPRPVSEIVDLFNLAQPTISRHLTLLKQSGLVTSRRKGQQVIYSLNEEALRDKGLGFFESFECCKSGSNSSSSTRKSK